MAKYVCMCVSVYVCGGASGGGFVYWHLLPPGSLGVASTISKKYTLLIWLGSIQIH